MTLRLAQSKPFAAIVLLGLALVGGEARALFFPHMQGAFERVRRASGEAMNAMHRLGRARNAEERAAVLRTHQAWIHAQFAFGPHGAQLEQTARAFQAAEDAIRRRNDGAGPAASPAAAAAKKEEDPEAVARAEVARQNTARASEEERKAIASAPPDINAWIAGQADGLARTAWSRLPGDITGSQHGNHGAFVGGAAALGSQSAPELRAQVGMTSARDFVRTKEGLIGLLNLRLGNYVMRYTNRVRTMSEVARRMAPVREQLWNSFPGEARWQRWSFDSEFNNLVNHVAANVAGRYPDGAPSAAEQGAAMAYALGEAQGFGKGYADRKIHEKRQQDEAAERERRRPENCWRTWQTCAHNIFRCKTEAYDCKLIIFCKLRTTCPWECTNWGANDAGCLLRNGWKAATGWLTDAWNQFACFVRQAWAAIENLARTAWEDIKKAAKWVAARADEATNWVGNQLNNLGGLLKRFRNLDLGELFSDPVGTLFRLLGDDMLKELTAPINALFDPLIKAASEEVRKVVTSTLQNMNGTLRDKVLIPAARWALEKIFGSNILANLREVAARVIGDVPAETRRITLAQEALLALAQRKLDLFDSTMIARQAELAKLEHARGTLMARALVAFTKSRLLAFIQSQGTRLLRVVLKILETPLHVARVAACSAIDAIPAIGSTLAFAVDFVVKEGIAQIRNRVAEFLSKTIVSTFVEPLLGKLEVAFTAGSAAGHFESWMGPLLEPVIPKLKETRDEIGKIIDAQNRLTQSLQAARKTAEAGPETKVELVGGGR